MRRHAPTLAVCLLTLAAPSFAQNTEKAKADTARESPIQDNSFLIEEAYNQEAGVVQHISLFQRAPGGNAYNYSFTQEWPLGGTRHQFSYTLSYVRSDPSVSAGIGDARINYRLGLGDGTSQVSVAPRLTAVIPAGDYKRGNGVGGAGIEGLIPISIVLSDALVAHLNAGATYIPSARNSAGATAKSLSWITGGSLVWLAHPNVNFLVEALHVNTEDVLGNSRTQRSGSSIISPGVRWAWNFESGLQIVPGIAIPVEVSNNNERSLLFYLSFEHSFLKNSDIRSLPGKKNGHM